MTLSLPNGAEGKESLPGKPSALWSLVAQNKRVFASLLMIPALAAGTGIWFNYRYKDKGIEQIPLQTPDENSTFVGEDISFQLDESFQSNGQADVVFDIAGADGATTLGLRGINLKLFIPQVPEEIVAGDPALERWFLTEREFNRQRVIFSAGSEHIDIPDNFGGYSADQLSIGLTNNCLGAGYWELAVYAETPEGKETVYQGYFNFSRGAYANMVSRLNTTQYWPQARNMEAWPGFGFLRTMPFNLGAFREVVRETEVAATDFADEEIMALGEQDSKSKYIVGELAGPTWADLRASDLQYQSFVPPGIYDPNKLWGSDYSQIETLDGAIGREVKSPLTSKNLKEVELVFDGSQGTRRLILMGLDMETIPQLATEDYSDGIYMPLGFGTPFTQDYEDLKATNPTDNPFMSIVLDDNGRIVNYRGDIGLNGIVLHRDEADPNVLHVYPMSYERITLVGHYTVNLSEI